MGYLPGQTTDETGGNDVDLSDRTGNERVVGVVKGGRSTAGTTSLTPIGRTVTR